MQAEAVCAAAAYFVWFTCRTSAGRHGLSGYLGHAHWGPLSVRVRLILSLLFPRRMLTRRVRSLVSCVGIRGARQRGQHRIQELHRERAQDH